MENNKENSIVPTLQTGSGVGSGILLTRRNRFCAKNLIKRRNEMGYSQQKISNLTGIGLKTIQNYESGSYPKGDYAIALAEVLECSLDWLLMDKRPAPDPSGGEKQIDKPEPLYNKVEIPGVSDGVVKYSAGIDLKDKLIRSQEKLISHLEKENNDLKAQLEAKYATNNMS